MPKVDEILKSLESFIGKKANESKSSSRYILPRKKDRNLGNRDSDRISTFLSSGRIERNRR